jgi:hypothetical protein
MSEVPTAIDVEITRRDRCVLAAERCQLPNDFCGDDRHRRLLVGQSVGGLAEIVYAATSAFWRH